MANQKGDAVGRWLLETGQAWTSVSCLLVAGKSGAPLARLPTPYLPIRAALFSSSPPGLSLMLSPVTLNITSNGVHI